MMLHRVIFLICLLTTFNTTIFGQTRDVNAYDSIYNNYVDSRFGDAHADLIILTELEGFLKKKKDTCRLARVYSWKSNCYDAVGQLDSSIALGYRALRLYHPNCDSLILMSINANLTSTYLSLGENNKVIDIANRNLKLWNDKWAETGSKNAFYTNKAIAQVYNGDFETGLVTFKEFFNIAKKDDKLIDVMDACNNISATYGILYDNKGILSYLDSSELYIQQALEIGKKLNKTEEVVIHFMNLASIYNDKGKYLLSLSFLDSALTLAEQGNYLTYLAKIADIRSTAYEGKGDLKNALISLRYHIVLKDSLLDSEKFKAISEMQEKYESEKKERQIKELEVTNLNSALREEQLTRTRNIYLFSGLGILLIAGGLWSRLRFTRKAKASIQKEKDISEGLLLNILPEEVANELKEKGEAEAKLVEHVTVLFTDFKGFTAMSEQLSPKDLVNDLNICFSEFDKIIGEHNIEKIKTIGDAYMAAGGLPVPNDTHASDVVKAAFKMRDFVEAGKARKMEAGLPFFEIRIGIHTGPVVAGIVGVKKFQYDIWGDTVNTASRMESSGAVGKVNISQTTYERIKENPDFEFESRGKIEAKGKGVMEMYFVSEKP